MATFAKASFDAAGYLASRPTYPAKLYEIIVAYHKHDNTGRMGHVLDLGCGPGFMALALSPSFAQTTGLDPSSKMVSVGQQPPNGKITYAVGNAEDLDTSGISEVDLVVAGQAAHWFDHRRAWEAIGRVLRPGGTVAYVGYGEMVFPKHPRLNHFISEYHSSGKDALGPYWAQPGRSIVEGLLDAVPFPVEPALTEQTSEVLSRLPNLYEGGYPVPERIHEPAPVGGTSGWDAASAVRIKRDSLGRQWFLHRDRWRWENLEGYLRTSSALNAFHEKHPEDAAKKGNGAQGDIVDRLVHRLREAIKKEEGKDVEEFDIAWPLVLMMVKREN